MKVWETKKNSFFKQTLKAKALEKAGAFAFSVISQLMQHKVSQVQFIFKV